MDRVMQMELDTLALDRLDVFKTHLASFSGGVDIPFIDGDTLAEWHEWVTSFVSREFYVGAAEIYGLENYTR